MERKEYKGHPVRRNEKWKVRQSAADRQDSAARSRRCVQLCVQADGEGEMWGQSGARQRGEKGKRGEEERKSLCVCRIGVMTDCGLGGLTHGVVSI